MREGTEGAEGSKAFIPTSIPWQQFSNKIPFKKKDFHNTNISIVIEPTKLSGRVYSGRAFDKRKAIPLKDSK